MFSGVKHQVRRLLERGGVIEQLGRNAFFSDKETALRTLLQTYAHGTARQELGARDHAAADVAAPRYSGG